VVADPGDEVDTDARNGRAAASTCAGRHSTCDLGRRWAPRCRTGAVGTCGVAAARGPARRSRAARGWNGRVPVNGRAGRYARNGQPHVTDLDRCHHVAVQLQICRWNPSAGDGWNDPVEDDLGAAGRRRAFGARTGAREPLGSSERRAVPGLRPTRRSPARTVAPPRPALTLAVFPRPRPRRLEQESCRSWRPPEAPAAEGTPSDDRPPGMAPSRDRDTSSIFVERTLTGPEIGRVIRAPLVSAFHFGGAEQRLSAEGWLRDARHGLDGAGPDPRARRWRLTRGRSARPEDEDPPPTAGTGSRVPSTKVTNPAAEPCRRSHDAPISQRPDPGPEGTGDSR